MTARTYDNPDVSWSSPQVSLPDSGTFAFTICTTVPHMLAMLSVLFEGGAGLGYGYIGDHNVDVIAALAEQPPPCVTNNPPTAETLERIGVASGITVGNALNGQSDCEDDMTPLAMLHMGGKDYLAELCFGQETILYEQGRAGVTKSPITGQFEIRKAADLKIDLPDGKDFSPVSAANLPTYADGAVAYLLGRCADYVETMASIAKTGIDIATNYDEAADVVAIAADLLGASSKSVLEWLGVTSIDEIKAAITSQTTIDTMTESWHYDGGLNRFQLISWAATAPWSVDGVVIKPLVIYWAMNSLLLGYNSDLQTIAAETETGQTLDDVNTSYQTALSHTSYDGGDGYAYDIWEYTPEVLIGQDGEWRPTTADQSAIGDSVAGVYIHATMDDQIPYDDKVTFGIVAHNLYAGASGVQDGTEGNYGITDPDKMWAATIANTYAGVTFGQWATNTDGAEDAIRVWTNQGIVLHRVIIVAGRTAI